VVCVEEGLDYAQDFFGAGAIPGFGPSFDEVVDVHGNLIMTERIIVIQFRIRKSSVFLRCFFLYFKSSCCSF
jgi:hypothetical protein